MLTGLSIRNIVLIEQLSLSFSEGLCALTGETGAGKSILLDALGLVLGARGDAGLVRHGAGQASVLAELELAGTHPALDLLREQDVEIEDGATVPLTLRRTLTADGRSRAFVNDQPVSVGLLRRLGETLVEVHGQFDTHGLLNPRGHRAVLDAYAGLTDEVERLGAMWRRWQQAERERDEAVADMTRARNEEDYLRHAVAELDAVEPAPGEEAQLAERRHMLMHREKLVEALTAGADALAGDRGAERALANAQRQLERAQAVAGGRLDLILETLDRALAETAEAMSGLHSLSADIELDTGELEGLEERLFALRALARKHGCEVDDLASLRGRLADRLALINDQGERLARLDRDAEAAREAFRAAATALGDRRRNAAAGLDAAVAAELPPLKLDKARFRTQVEALPEAEWSAAGQDRVSFTVATNPGATPGPLARIVSGGELARFMLALKVVLAHSRMGAGAVPTLVFDEVDSGISGAVADAVGERLARLGEDVQVLVITHSPQVAARATHHWQVRKSEGPDLATTTVVELVDGQRREEIARMLSGAVITDQARAAADSLMTQRQG